MTAPAAAPTTPSRDPNLPRSWSRDAAGNARRDLSLRDLATALEDPGSVVWVDIDSTNRHQFALLEKVFHFHPLAIEDTLNPNSRVKLDEYEGHLFAIIRGVEFDATTTEPHDLTTFNLCCFLGKNYIVIGVRARPRFCRAAPRARCTR
jgi:magnesium transporter